MRCDNAMALEGRRDLFLLEVQELHVIETDLVFGPGVA